MPSEVSFGEWVRRRRRAWGLTQQQLADQVGCSTITIRKIEAEQRRASEQIARRLARIFDVPEAEQAEFLRFARGAWAASPAVAPPDAPWRAPATISHIAPPTPLTSFIGREAELEAIRQELQAGRLVTLKGPGGVGKTRLAIEAASRAAGSFPEGACWVDLAGLTDPGLVPQALADALGLRELSDQSLRYVLLSYLRERRMLLVLDNCEHLAAACAELAGLLLGSCPQLRILATSREGLGLTGERVWPVPALSLPDPHRTSLEDLLMGYEGVRLFVERAAAVSGGFRLTKDNAPAVVRICLRLDGMPLAIELAAARIAMLSAAEIGRRLDDRFALLTTGSRAALPRHQTLRAAIDWSHDLLSAAEQALFRRLSVFAGGFTLEAAEAVAGAGLPPTQVLELLGQLINKSLVVVKARAEGPESETRYDMFESIQEYARERLQGSGEGPDALRRHRDHFIDLAERADAELKGPHQLEWLQRLELEHENLRSALQCAAEADESDTLIRMSGALGWFWYRRGHFAEGRAWLQRGLSRARTGVPSGGIATALYLAAHIARAQGDFLGARRLVEDGIAQWRALESGGRTGLFLAQTLLADLTRDGGDPATARILLEQCAAFFRDTGEGWGLAWSLMQLGMAIRDQDDYTSARSCIGQSADLWREQGELWGTAEALHALGLVEYRQGDYAAACLIAEELLELRRELGDRRWFAYATHNIGVFSLAQGDVQKARRYFDQDLALFREVGDRSGVALCLQYQGLLAHMDGEDERAQAILAGGLQLASETGPQWICGNYLLWYADIASSRGEHERAVRLCGAAYAIVSAAASFWDAFERSCHERIMEAARASLGSDESEVQYRLGQGWSQQQAIAYARQQAG